MQAQDGMGGSAREAPAPCVPARGRRRQRQHSGVSSISLDVGRPTFPVHLIQLPPNCRFVQHAQVSLLAGLRAVERGREGMQQGCTRRTPYETGRSCRRRSAVQRGVHRLGERLRPGERSTARNGRRQVVGAATDPAGRASAARARLHCPTAANSQPTARCTHLDEVGQALQLRLRLRVLPVCSRRGLGGREAGYEWTAWATA